MFGFNGAKLKGSFGQSQVRVITDTTPDQNLFLAPIVVFNCSSLKTINGMQAPKDLAFVTFFNIGSANVNINHGNAAAIVPNRFSFPNSAQQVLRQGYGVTFWYDFNAQSWRLTEQPHISATSPITVSTANLISMTQSNGSTSGWLSGGDWNTFNAKLGGTGAANRIPYYTGTSVLGNQSGFVFTPTTQRMGIQQATPLAAQHVVSNILETVANPTSNTVSLVQFIPAATANSATATQTAGRLMNPNTPAAAENSSGASPWTAGDTLDYRISAVYDDGGGNYTECAAYTDTPQVTLANNNNGVDVGWADDPSGAFGSAAFFRVYRSYNGSGFTEYTDIVGSGFTDDGNSFNGGSYPTNALFADYVANGTIRTYDAYSTKTEAGQTVYAATAVTYNMTDDSSGKPYGVSHSISSGETGVRVVGAPDGVSQSDYIDGTSFIEYADSWTGGASVTPNSLGYVSDGFILNRTYRLYNKGVISSTAVYSAEAGAISASVSDPNDATTYYIQLSMNWTGGAGSDGFKVIRDIDGAGFLDSLAVTTGSTSGTYYDTDSQFVANAITTPNGIAVIASIIEKGGTSVEAAHQVIKGTADYARIEFQDSTSAKLIGFEADATEGKLTAKNTTPVMRWENAKVAFYNATPVTQPANTVAINQVLVDLGLRASGGTSNFTTNLSAPNLTSGTYTPTLTNAANLGASTAYQCQYMRVGNVVTVSGKVDVDPTLAATATQLGISLPIASNLGAQEDCAGTSFASGIAAQGAAIRGDAANNRAEMVWISGDVTNQSMYFTFTYEVI